MATEMMLEMTVEDVSPSGSKKNNEESPSDATVNPFRFINENTECQESDIMLKIKEEVDSDPDPACGGETTSFCYGLAEEISLNKTGGIDHYNYDNSDYTAPSTSANTGALAAPSDGGEQSDKSSTRGQCGSDYSSLGEMDVVRGKAHTGEDETMEANEDHGRSRRASAIAARKKLKKINRLVENNPKIAVKRYKRHKSSDEWSEGDEYHPSSHQATPGRQDSHSSASVNLEVARPRKKTGNERTGRQRKSCKVDLSDDPFCTSEAISKLRGVEKRLKEEYWKWHNAGGTMTVQQVRAHALSIASERGLRLDQFQPTFKWARRFKNALMRDGVRKSESSDDSSDDTRSEARPRRLKSKEVMADHNYVMSGQPCFQSYLLKQKLIASKASGADSSDAEQRNEAADENLSFLAIYLKQKGVEEEIHFLPPKLLNMLLGDFFSLLELNPLWRYWQPKIFTSLASYLTRKQYPYDITTCPIFQDAKPVAVQDQGGQEKKDLTRLMLRMNTLRGLLWCVWWHNYQCLGIVSIPDHLGLKWGDIRLCTNDKGQEVLEYSRVIGSVPYIRRIKKTVRSTSSSPNSPYNPVVIYKQYSKRRPLSMRAPTAPFYLALDVHDPRELFKSECVSPEFLFDLCVKIPGNTVEALRKLKMKERQPKTTKEKKQVVEKEPPSAAKASEEVKSIHSAQGITQKPGVNIVQLQMNVQDHISALRKIAPKEIVTIGPQVAQVRPQILFPNPGKSGCRVVSVPGTTHPYKQMVSILTTGPQLNLPSRPVAAVNPQMPEPSPIHTIDPSDANSGMGNDLGLCISEVRGHCHNFDHLETGTSKPEGTVGHEGWYQGGPIEIKPIDDPDDIDEGSNIPSYFHQSAEEMSTKLFPGDTQTESTCERLELPVVADFGSHRSEAKSALSKSTIMISSEESDSDDLVVVTPSAQQQHTCPTCGKDLPSAPALWRHQRIMHLEGLIKCEACMVRIPADGVTSHSCLGQRRNRSNRPSWKCKSCETVYVNRHTWSLHMKNYHPRQLKKCRLCGKAFISNDMLRNHLQRMHPSRKLKANFVNTSWMPEQASTTAPVTGALPSWMPERASSTAPVTGALRCSWCYKCFINKPTLRMHELRVHGRTTQETTKGIVGCPPIGLSKFGTTTIINFPHSDKTDERPPSSASVDVEGDTADDDDGSKDSDRDVQTGMLCSRRASDDRPDSPLNSDTPDTFGNLVPRSCLSSSEDDPEPEVDIDRDFETPGQSSQSTPWDSGRILGRSGSGSSDEDDTANDVFTGENKDCPGGDNVQQPSLLSYYVGMLVPKLSGSDDDSGSSPVSPADTAGMLVPKLRITSSDEDIPPVPIATPSDTQNLTFIHGGLAEGSTATDHLESEGKFCCQTCGQTFKKERNLIIHKNNINH